MFEKEAEEYIKEHTFFDEEYGVQSLDVVSKTIFKDGAEFGYNKGFEFGVKSNEKVNQIMDNEWHYVKDGDYPKEKGNYLVAWKRTHHVEEYGKWGFDVDLFNADEGYFEGVGDYVIAWKEIVLPELPKESE